jgi:hypothetical protein
VVCPWWLQARRDRLSGRQSTSSSRGADRTRQAAPLPCLTFWALCLLLGATALMNAAMAAAAAPDGANYTWKVPFRTVA